MWKFEEPGAKFQATAPNHPEALIGRIPSFSGCWGTTPKEAAPLSGPPAASSSLARKVSPSGLLWRQGCQPGGREELGSRCKVRSGGGSVFGDDSF